MPEPPYPRDEALKRFDERYDALAASSRRTPKQYGSDEGAGAGYRLIGELIGGVLTGLGLGWLLDRFAGTAPFGLIGGVLIGSAAAIYLAVRSAARMSASAPEKTQGPAPEPVTTQVSAPAPVKMNEGPDQGA
jgi:ATP synthase protein I